jgi:hypothetical protein
MFYPFYIPERLRRKDLEVAKAIEEKQTLITEILHISKQNFDPNMSKTGQKDVIESLKTATEQGIFNCP